MKKNRIILLITAILTLILCGCAKEENELKEDLLNINYEVVANEAELSQYETENPVVALYIERYGSVVIELYPDIAPNTVNNFIYLVKKGFYDNNTFHRLVPGFVLQGGDPTGTGTGGPGYTIKGEFTSNNYTNNLKHEKWVISMARSNSYDSAGSQFFIMLGEASYLDGEYASFGKIIDGKDVIERIEKEETVANEQTGQLKKNLTIKKALIDLKGNSYEAVEKITNE